jgi:hypothetical protein
MGQQSKKTSARSLTEKMKKKIGSKPRSSKTVVVKVTDAQTGVAKAVSVELRTGGKIPVSARGIIQRINRVLATDHKQLKTAKGAQARLDCGHFYVVDLRQNCMARHNVSLEELAVEMGVLRSYEEIRD